MIALVIPCHNEEKRLHLAEFSKYASSDLQFFFVDDGSTDQTAQMIENAAKHNSAIHLIRLTQNKGKAEAVRAGMQEILHWMTAPESFQPHWIGYWDADLATPLSEISKMLDYAGTYPRVDSIWASRVYRLGAEIERSALRHYLGRVFATLIATLLKVKSYDTQCGAKLFKPETLQAAFAESFLSNWIFDVEILLRLQANQFSIVEYPVTIWKDVPGSKVKILKEAGRVLRDILHIRRKFQAHLTDHNKSPRPALDSQG